MNEIKIPQSIQFCAEDHDPGETIELIRGESGAIFIVGTIYNFYDLSCLEENQLAEVDQIAIATADKVVRAYNNHDDLIETLWQVLYADVDNHIPDALHKRARAVLTEAKGKS